MLASVGCVIFGGIYFLLARTYKKTDLEQRERSPVDGTRQIVGTIATVAAVFVLIEFVMYWASDLDWANQGLLIIERTLSQVRFALDLTVKSTDFFWEVVAVLLVSICLPFICVLFGIDRRLVTGIKWLKKTNVVLVIVTSLTFFGTGTRDGLAKIEASLVENGKKVERGLEDVEDLGRQIAEQAVEDAISEVIKEHNIQEKIAELINYDDIIDDYPYITWPQAWKLIDETLSNDSKLSGWRVAEAKSAQASATSFVQSISEFEAARPSNRTVPVEKLTILRPPDATLDRVQYVQAESERFVAPEPSPMSLEATKIDRAVRLSVSLVFDQFAALLLSFIGGESAVCDIPKLFAGETLGHLLKEARRVATTQFIKHVFVDGLTPAVAYSRVKRNMKRIARRLFDRILSSRFDSIIDRLGETKRSLVNLVNEKSNALSDASKKAQAARIRELSVKLEEYGKEISRNTIAKSGLRAFRSEFSKHLDSVSGTDAVERLRWFESQVESLPQEASTLKRIEQLIKIESELHEPHHFKNSIERLIDQIMAVEHKRKWGGVRQELEEAVDKGKLNVSGEKKERAKATLKGWREERGKIALKVAFGPEGSRSLTLDVFEKAFGSYVRKNSDMTALWGFAVIGCLDLSDFAADGIFRARDLKPAHGYLRYVKATGLTDLPDAMIWVGSRSVNHSIAQICPY